MTDLFRVDSLYVGPLGKSADFFKGIGDAAPAFGMNGNLVGKVQMLSSMDDTASIAPAMAVAL